MIWDDVNDAASLRDWIRAHPERAVDNYVLELSSSSSSSEKIKTALVFPPIIYGSGLGPGNRRSAQVPELTRVALERGKGVQVGKGLARWANVHVEDVGRAFVKLAECAIEEQRDERLWNQLGLYFVRSGELVSIVPNSTTQTAIALTRVDFWSNSEASSLRRARCWLHRRDRC